MILVTGGTGFVGQEVVTHLLAAGQQVRLLVRDPRHAAIWANHPLVELVRGDALRPETLPAALTGMRAVIHLIGIIAETSKVTFEQGHIEATRNVLAAARQAGVTRWIQMSAAGTRPNASSRYHQTKWQAEELVRQSGLDWTILRPSLIYGYDERDRLLNLLRRALSWPLDAVQLHSFPLLDGGRPRVQPVSVREVAHCFAHAVANKTALNRTFDLVGPVALPWREMVLKILTALGRNATYEEVPVFLALRVLAALATILLPILIVAGVATCRLSLAQADIGAGLWVGLALTVSRGSQRTVLFNLPSRLLRFVGEVLHRIAPRSLQFREQLKMAMEDNVGDPRPAMATFAYVPETFEEALEKIFGTKRG